MASKSKSSKAPAYTDLAPDAAVIGAPVIGPGPDGKARTFRVQSVRGKFALATFGPEADVAAPGGVIGAGTRSGTFGMYGTVGNGAAIIADGATLPACIGHGKSAAPVIGGGYLYAFIGTVPNTHGAIPASGRWCESCTRAVALDGSIIGRTESTEAGTESTEAGTESTEAGTESTEAGTESSEDHAE